MTPEMMGIIEANEHKLLDVPVIKISELCKAFGYSVVINSPTDFYIEKGVKR